MRPMSKITLFLLYLAVTALLSAACSPPLTGSTSFALGTVCTQTVYANEETVRRAEELLADIHAEFSRYETQSDISGVNANPDRFVQVSAQTYELIEQSVKYAKLTRGAFDPTYGAVSDAWGFSTEPTVPSKAELDELIEQAGYERVEFDHANLSVKIPHGMVLDLGGIVKGYAGDALVDFYTGEGVTDALINLGGNIVAMGDKAGTPFTVGIRDPHGEPGEYFCTLEMHDYALVTSGAYERNFISDGVVYHHIIDTVTGYPSSSDVVSASIVAVDGTLADALSTAVFALGSRAGMELINSIEGVHALLLLDDNTFVTTDGFEEYTNFKVVKDEYVKKS